MQRLVWDKRRQAEQGGEREGKGGKKRNRVRQCQYFVVNLDNQRRKRKMKTHQKGKEEHPALHGKDHEIKVPGST